MTTPLEPYVRTPVELQAWDPRLPRVAAELARTVTGAAPDVVVEHVGSSAVPGLAGKGYVDLMVEVPAQRVASLVAALVDAGWQRQTEPWAFPDTRPMLRTAIVVEGSRWQSHLHVIPRGSPEAAELVGLRDALRGDPALRARYVAAKRAVLEDGTTDMLDYAEAKGDTVIAMLRELGLRS